MKSTSRLGLATALLAFSLSATGSLAMGPIQATAETANYRLELDIGGSEMMYSKADAQRLKPTSGEVMVSGKMTGSMPAMEGMSSTASSGSMAAANVQHHLELHVLSKATGKAVQGAKVTITVAGATAKKPIVVPIAVMYGIAQGEADWHYGNNIQLAAGHYVVEVTANGEATKFNITVPAM